MNPETAEYDYIVVGAGAAGCVVASRLSEDPSNRVALVEAGGPDRHVLLRIPALAMFTTLLREHNWDFHSEPVPGLNGRKLQFNQGRGLGGSSSVNGMIYMRGNSREYDAWNASGCEGWSFAEVLPFFKRSETNARGEGRWHGGKGPLPIRRSNSQLPICEAFLSAAASAGFSVVEDLSGSDVLDGFGYYDVNISRGKRVSSASAFLKPSLGRKNLTVLTGSRVARVLVERGRAQGIEIVCGGAREELRAAREVILCAGAYNSPQLLMLSGIGPPDHLREIGIEPRVPAPEVGQNLRNHPGYALRYTCSQPITAYRDMRPLRAVSAGLRYLLSGGGPLGESYVATGGFFRSDPALQIADTIIVMAPGLTRRAQLGGKPWDMLPNQHGFQVSVIVGRPQSRGEVRLHSADPASYPQISPNYFDDPQDMQTLLRAMRRVRDMLSQPSIANLISGELQPGAGVRDEEALRAEIRARSMTASHPMGTCRMGSDDGAVVDPSLRVRGVEGLRVADLSIVPSPLCACTHGPGIMIGEKAAEFIRKP